MNQVREMIQLTKQHGIKAGTFIMVGYPGETDEDVQLTLEHLKKSDPDQYTITVAYPIKGTPLYEEVEHAFLEQLPWESSTDRQIDFKRTYSRKYYDYAVRWIYNEMTLHRLKNNGNFNISKWTTLKAKSFASRSFMKWEMKKG